MTYRVNGIREETPERYLEISEELARERDIESGRWVRVTSRHGSLAIKVVVTSRVHGKQVYLAASLARRTHQRPYRLTCRSRYKHSRVQGDNGEHQAASGKRNKPSPAAELSLLRKANTTAWSRSGAQVETQRLSHAG
jgi:predicted molibdopterin-dependent oxidoreductase YjgC